MGKRSHSKYVDPVVRLSDVTDDKELLEVVRSVLQPGIEALVWRGAMLARQVALTTVESYKADAAVTDMLVTALRSIRDIDLGDCEKYVRKADEIACKALAEYDSTAPHKR